MSTSGSAPTYGAGTSTQGLVASSSLDSRGWIGMAFFGVCIAWQGFSGLMPAHGLKSLNSKGLGLHQYDARKSWDLHLHPV
ncbi:hypothetical protein FCV25MIE_28937 [Fagus crenata]